MERGFGGAPVVEWYATTETGPIAYSCKAGRGLHVLPFDLLEKAVMQEFVGKKAVSG